MTGPIESNRCAPMNCISGFTTLPPYQTRYWINVYCSTEMRMSVSVDHTPRHNLWKNILLSSISWNWKTNMIGWMHLVSYSMDVMKLVFRLLAPKTIDMKKMPRLLTYIIWLIRHTNSLRAHHCMRCDTVWRWLLMTESKDSHSRWLLVASACWMFTY